MEGSEKCDVFPDGFKVANQPLSSQFSFLSTVIRAKVVGKKLMRDGPFGTMRYTVKQMKVCIMNTGCTTQWQTLFLLTIIQIVYF